MKVKFIHNGAKLARNILFESYKLKKKNPECKLADCCLSKCYHIEVLSFEHHHHQQQQQIK